MAETRSSVPVKTGKEAGAAPAGRKETLAHPLQTLRDQVDRLFDEFGSGFSLFPFGRRAFEVEPWWRTATAFGATAPAVDVVEKDDAIQIAAELPGMDEKDIEVSVADDMLTIRGEKKEEKEEKRRNYYMAERRYGSFERSFRLPASVNQDKIDASFQKGVLTIVLPKTEEAKKKAKKIAIKAK
jgi:HSP20 family protein